MEELLFLKKENKDFYKYIDTFNYINKILILPYKNHFFFTSDEVQNYKIILNLKELNYIKNLNTFLSSLQCISSNSVFCGCFKNNKSKSHKYVKFLISILHIFDYNMERLLSEREINSFFNTYKFKIFNVTEINNLTYFCAKKMR